MKLNINFLMLTFNIYVGLMIVLVVVVVCDYVNLCFIYGVKIKLFLTELNLLISNVCFNVSHILEDFILGNSH